MPGKLSGYVRLVCCQKKILHAVLLANFYFAPFKESLLTRQCYLYGPLQTHAGCYLKIEGFSLLSENKFCFYVKNKFLFSLF